MNKQVIYVVVQTSGSYSDYSHTNLCAFFDKTEAELLVLKFEEQQAKILKAKNLIYENEKVWTQINPRVILDFPPNEYDDLSRLKRKKNLSSKEEKRLAQLELKQSTRLQAHREYAESFRNELIRFINTLDFLNEEDKLILTDPSKASYYHTDTSYYVEELDIK